MATAAEIQHAAALIRSGKLVAFPTETVYGLGANALDAEAVARIFEAKRRPRASPLIVHVSSVEMARSIASEWPETADQLSARFWPGPLTLILPKQRSIPDMVTAGLPSVGIRVPRHPVALALIRAAGVPIAAPSANAFTKLSPTSAEHVLEGLGTAVDFVLEGGFSEVGIESTVVALTGPPMLLRPGAVTATELEATIGPLEAVGAIAAEAHPAPGMHRQHYRPGIPLVVGDEPVTNTVVRVWWHRRLNARNAVQLPASARAYAAALYRTLHELDKQPWDYIQVEPVPESAEWAAVRDRLTRAAENL